METKMSLIKEKDENHRWQAIYSTATYFISLAKQKT